MIPEKEPPKKTFSWITFFIVLLGGQFLYNWSYIDSIVDNPAYTASSMTARTLIIALAAMAVGKLATKL